MCGAEEASLKMWVELIYKIQADKWWSKNFANQISIILCNLSLGKHLKNLSIQPMDKLHPTTPISIKKMILPK